MKIEQFDLQRLCILDKLCYSMDCFVEEFSDNAPEELIDAVEELQQKLESFRKKVLANK